MGRLIFFWFCIIMLCGVLSADPGGKLTKININTEKDIYALHFADNMHGWAVGEKGLILHTSDGGHSWSEQKSGIEKSNLLSVFFLDEKTGWACGDILDGPKVRYGHIVGGRPMTSGAILKTGDGGKTWKKFWGPGNFTLTDIWMIDKDNGIMVNHGGARHKDGDTILGSQQGTKWPRTRRAFRALHAVQFLNKTECIAVGTRVMVGFLPTPKDPLYVKNTCRIIRSEDGGKSWKPAEHPPIKGAEELLGVHFKDEKNGWACGSHGNILHSEDGGKTWTKQDAGVKEHLTDVHTIDAGHAWAVGDKGVIINTGDGGTSWQKVDSGTDVMLRGVWFTAKGYGVIVGRKGTVFIYEEVQLPL